MLYLLQVISGFLLSIHYNDFFQISFDTVIYIIIDVNNGFSFRLLHILGATLFMFSIMIHWIRNIWMKLKIIYIFSITELIIITGWIIFIFTMIEGFLGYLLCWGQMSHRGITVMINIVCVLPGVGIIICDWSYSPSSLTLLRSFYFHFYLVFQ